MRRALALAALSSALAACGGGGSTHAASPPTRAAVVHPPTRAAATVDRRLLLGRSALGRPIYAVERGNPAAARRVLVVGCIHGTEYAGVGVTRFLERGPSPRGTLLWIVPDLNPDGVAAGIRTNGRGVDLNRNFPSQWRPIGIRGDPQYSGPRPLSEPETRLIRRLILRVRPVLSIWYHQPQDVVRAWGQSIPAARRYARLAHAPFRAIRWPSGTAANWQNHRFPGTSSFVVEFAGGPIPQAVIRNHAAAVRALAP